MNKMHVSNVGFASWLSLTECPFSATYRYFYNH